MRGVRAGLVMGKGRFRAPGREQTRGSKEKKHAPGQAPLRSIAAAVAAAAAAAAAAPRSCVAALTAAMQADRGDRGSHKPACAGGQHKHATKGVCQKKSCFSAQNRLRIP